MRLWEVATGAPIRTLTGHTHEVFSVAFSPDGNTLASGGGWTDQTVRLWEVTTGAPIRTLTGHTGAVFSVAFSPDGNTLASASADGTVLLWELIPSAITNTTVSITPSPIPSPAIGSPLTLSLTIADGQNVAGYQATLGFDTAALRYLSSANGDYLPTGAFFAPPVVSENKVVLTATSLTRESTGDGTLATVTFEVIAVKASTVSVSEVVLSDSAGAGIRPQVENGQVIEPPQITGISIRTAWSTSRIWCSLPDGSVRRDKTRPM